MYLDILGLYNSKSLSYTCINKTHFTTSTNSHCRYEAINFVFTQYEMAALLCELLVNVGLLQQCFWMANSVTRLGDILDFGQLFKAFGSN